MRNRSGLMPKVGGTNQGTPGVVVGHVNEIAGLAWVEIRRETLGGSPGVCEMT